MNYLPLLLTYNNPEVLPETLSNLSRLGFESASITVIENGSHRALKQKALDYCHSANVKVRDYPINRGWGGAINDYLSSTVFGTTDILLIMAHDCYFKSIDLADVSRAFKSSNVLFVSPNYPDPVTCHYNIINSFYTRRKLSEGIVKIGNHTALFARAIALQSFRYDEEFHVYGGEFEIFMQASDSGFKTISLATNVIVNPGTDAPSAYGLFSHKINSLYYAYKRHGVCGFILRYVVIVLSLVAIIWRSGFKSQQALMTRNALTFALLNPGRGMRTFLEKQPNGFGSYNC